MSEALKIANSQSGGLAHSVTARAGVQPAPSPVYDIEFYLDVPKASDCADVAELAKDKRFLFAPFNDLLKLERKNPYAAAADVVLGRDNDIMIAIRQKSDHSFLGLVRFTSISRGRAELSYFFIPSRYRQGLGRSAVLRSLDWAIKTHNLKAIWATFDPQNIPSFKILDRAGLKKITRFDPHSGYVDSAGRERARLHLVGNVKNDITNALNDAKAAGYFTDEPPTEDLARLASTRADIPATVRPMGARVAVSRNMGALVPEGAGC